MEEIVNKYKDKELQYGVLDCHLLVLDYIGFDTTNLIGSYSDYKTGAKIALALTGCKSLAQYLESIGYTKVSHTLARDGSIVMDGISCSIYYDGGLFGVWDNVFKFKKIRVSHLKDLGVYNG